MGRMLVAGLTVLMVGAFLVIGIASQAPPTVAGQVPTDTPTPTVSATATPSASATATATAAGTATPTGSPAGSATRTSTASPAQPAAVPVTGGDPSGGSANLALMLVIGIGAVAGAAGVLAVSYGAARRS